MTTSPLPEPTVISIMEQAQVFASAWWLVGGTFDDGSMFETADAEKSDLRKMVYQFNTHAAAVAAAKAAEIVQLQSLLKEARKIIRASSSRNLVKDWDERTTAALKESK